MGQLSSDMDMINLRPFFKNGTFFVKKFFSYFEKCNFAEKISECGSFFSFL